MNKKVCFIFLFLLVMSSFFIAAANETAVDKKAAVCLNAQIKEKGCAALSTEEKIFSLLSVGQCKTELIADSLNKECWPEEDCNVKTTAQAILALKKYNEPTSAAERWLSAKEANFSTGITWYLQVETSNHSDCRANYLGKEYDFDVEENQALSGSAGKCLTVADTYWFKVNSACYNRDIEISCEDSFSTSLFFKRTSSQMIYVLESAKSASGEGTTTERVGSSCFKDGKNCDYEGTLWASIVLKDLGKNVDNFIPYLLSASQDNLQYIPESFLYLLTNKYNIELLEKQRNDQWWLESGDKFYDTAVALLPFQNDDSLPEKSSSKAWLAEIQDSNGCWQGNIRNTGFLLYSLWTKKANISSSVDDCESSNYFCSSEAACSDANGSVLSNFGGCDGITSVCCDKQEPLEQCSALEGELCRAGEECYDGTRVDSLDSIDEKICCVEGTCKMPTQTTTSSCVSNGGSCRSSCLDNEVSSFDSCSSEYDLCCIQESKGFPIILILILGILILLAVFGIIFKDKIRAFLFSKKNKSNKSNTSSTTNNPRFPPTSSSNVYPGAVQRRIMPQQNQQQVVRKPQDKTEFNEVLKKLKEIGN